MIYFRCPVGYSGETCETEVKNVCDTVKCQNGAHCEEIGEKKVKCSMCSQRYTGKLLFLQILLHVCIEYRTNK